MNFVLRVRCFSVYSALYLSFLYLVECNTIVIRFVPQILRPRSAIIYQFGLQQTRPTTIRCHLVVEHHGSLTVPSFLTASALLQGRPSRQSRRKEREKRRRPRPSLLPAAPQCSSSTNFSTVSAPRPPPLTNSLKTKLERPRRRRVLTPPSIARDVSARLEYTHYQNTLPSARPAVSFSAPYNLHIVPVHTAAHRSSHAPQERRSSRS